MEWVKAFYYIDVEWPIPEAPSRGQLMGVLVGIAESLSTFNRSDFVFSCCEDVMELQRG